MNEVYTTTQEMYDRIVDFRAKFASNKDNVPEELHAPMVHLDRLEEVLKVGLDMKFAPNDKLVQDFGLAALLMDLFEKSFFVEGI